jgi:uncharacterized protein involved in type VI secretion and phage assembly
MERYDYAGMYAFSQSDEAQRHALLQMQAREARQQVWAGLSTVRSLRAGLRFEIDGHPRLGVAGAVATPKAWVSTQVIQVGINNLPYATQGASSEVLPALVAWLEAQLAMQAQGQGQSPPVSD